MDEGSSNLDEKITQFLAVTGSSDVDRARSYLEMSGGNLETSVGLWMEHTGGSEGASASTGAATRGDMMGAPASSSGGFDEDVRAPDQTRTMRLMDFDDNGGGRGGAMAAALAAGGMLGPHAHGYGAMGMGMDAGTTGGAGAAMMSAFSDELPTSASGSGPVDARAAVNRAAAAAAGGSGGGGGSGDGDDDDSDVASGDAGSGGGAGGDDVGNGGDNGGNAIGEREGLGTAAPAGGGARATSLADMFAPPENIIYAGAGGFQGARQAAKDSRRWLLVNIQSDSDFACHALNRDVWRDELVENVVRSSFIFWQSVDAHPDGSTYISRYKVVGYPHVAIIDPRTGRLMWKKEGWTQVNPMTAVQFAETAADFCSRHSFEKPPSAPRSSTSSGPTSSSGSKRPIVDMSEEEQLQAAIRASMADAECDLDADEGEESACYESNEDYDPDDVMVEANVAEGEEQADVSQQSQKFEMELLGMEVGDEPSPGENTARVQIRMPDGKRLVRKFHGDDSVKVIFAFVAQQVSEAIGEGKQLQLKAGFPPRDLFADVDNDISSCGLAGEAITARWK